MRRRETVLSGNLSRKQQVELKQEVPMFVGLPRTGNKWIMAVMEVYFQRQRYKGHNHTPSWAPGEWNSNPMWASDHDGGLAFKTTHKVIYLYRDPVASTFSLCRLNHIKRQKDPIVKHANYIKQHYEKWATPNNEDACGTNDVLVIQYEKFLNEDTKMQELRRISEHWGKEWDPEQAKLAFNTCGDKKRTISQGGKAAFKNPASHTEQYQIDREAFREKWGEIIYSHSGFNKEQFEL